MHMPARRRWPASKTFSRAATTCTPGRCPSHAPRQTAANASTPIERSPPMHLEDGGVLLQHGPFQLRRPVPCCLHYLLHLNSIHCAAQEVLWYVGACKSRLGQGWCALRGLDRLQGWRYLREVFKPGQVPAF